MTSIIHLYNENMNFEMTIKKLGSAYKFRVGRATGNEHIFLFGLIWAIFEDILVIVYQKNTPLGYKITCSESENRNRNFDCQ